MSVTDMGLWDIDDIEEVPEDLWGDNAYKDEDSGEMVTFTQAIHGAVFPEIICSTAY